MVGKLWYLKKVDLLNSVDDDVLERLSEITDMQEVADGKTVFFPGERSDTLYFLKKGRVKISRRTPEGRRITLALLEPGEIFGELSIAGQDERDTRAEAVEKSLVCSIGREQFEEVLSDHPELAMRITRVIGDRRREVESKVENMIFKDAPARLAHILENLFENHGEPDNGTGRETSIAFSHQEIADLSGLTRPTTTNLLNEFQDEGLIELGRRQIRLCDPGGLNRRSNSS